MNEELSPEIKEKILDALAHGQKIQAIKIYRNATRQGLKDAKNFVEALYEKLREEDPETYGAPGQNSSGCSVQIGVILVILGLLGLTLS